jgi:hypothetical protein
MKTVKISLSIIFMLAFIGLNESFGQWAVNGTHIYNTNSGFVGIGTNTPIALLDAAKNATGPTISVRNLGGTGGAQFQMIDNASGADWKFKATLTGGFKIRDNGWGLDVFQIEPNSSLNAIYIDAAGDVAMSHNAPDGHGLNVRSYTTGKAAVYGTDQNGSSIYATGMLGVLSPGLLGVPISVTNVGVLGIKPALGNNGAAVYGWNNDINSANYGGLFVSDGAATSYINYGVYCQAMHASTNFAGQFSGRVQVDGHPSATEAPDYTATVFKSVVNHSQSADTRAVDGVSTPADGYGIGVYGTGGYMGVRGLANAGAYTGTGYGVYGSATGTDGIRIGVYGTASGGINNWAGYFVGDAYISSDLRIGTLTQATGYSLSVNGKVACTEVLVEAFANWPDYVFADDYKLLSLDELEQSIQENNHLPGLPSAAEIEEDGLQLGDMQKRMVEKLEELTLYTIEQGKLINELRQRMEDLEKENAHLNSLINK